jgi:carbon monoxide dehydrogenase subunit G
MDITGEHWLPAPPEVVWETLHDESTLRLTIPGCKELTQTAPNAFAGSASVGIGVIKGLYKGTLELTEEHPYSGATIRVEARSGHAEIRGLGEVQLQASDGGTLVRYHGEARISGPLAAVGQRLLPSATKSLTQTFLKNVEDVLQLRESEEEVKEG